MKSFILIFVVVMLLFFAKMKYGTDGILIVGLGLAISILAEITWMLKDLLSKNSPQDKTNP